MLEKLIGLVTDDKKRNVLYMVGGMAGLLTGSKLGSLVMFGKGALGLEQIWNDVHPDHKNQRGPKGTNNNSPAAPPTIIGMPTMWSLRFVSFMCVDS